MTLRLRLVGALGLLLLVGLAAFGLATYQFYAASQYERLDDQLRAALPFLERDLNDRAGNDRSPGGGPGGDARPPAGLPTGTYAELRDADGAVDAEWQGADTGNRPAIPDELPAPGRFVTVGSSEGEGEWRLTSADSLRPPGYTVVGAVPTNDVTTALQRLLVVEIVVGAVLLAVLSVGSWLILRRGLRPLEHMAASAGRISAGALSERVAPADGRGEVGQLGLALNTMLEEIEAAFRQRDATEQRLRQFLADASHELRTPLTSIQGFAELFRLGVDNPDLDLPVVLRRIEQEAARMRLLVDDLLLLARLDQTRPAEHVAVDLAVLAADACTDAAAVDPSRPISLDVVEPVVVAGAVDHLRQAIGNLVANALRHTPPGTPVEVATRLRDGVATITVADQGPGLDHEALAHAFDRFWQADRARVGTGAGLGLAIVAAIAEEHGGTACAANRAGGGALFTITLPLDGLARQSAHHPSHL